MNQFVDADNLIPENPQIAYVDGAMVGDRVLEGVLFEITLDENGDFVCTGVRPEDREYYDDFSAKKQKEWCELILRDLDQGMCDLVSEDGRDIEVVDETGAIVPPKNPRTVVAREIPVYSFKEREQIAIKEFGDLIGLTVPQAEKRAHSRGIEVIRTSFIDGEAQGETLEYRADRLNVAIESGKIKTIVGVG
jgi:hypothetical protein